MRQNGDVSRIDARVGSDEAARLRALEEALREGAAGGTYKAAAVVSDLRLKPTSTGIVGGAIAVDLDHRDGYSARFLVPYTFADDGQFATAAPFATAAHRRFFPPPDPDR
jgi:hypothetical protein